VVALLVFGPKRLPELGRSLGRGLQEFRRASTELKTSIEREIQAAEVEQEIRRTSTELKSSIEREIEAADVEQAMAQKPVASNPDTEKPIADQPSVEKPSEVSSPK